MVAARLVVYESSWLLTEEDPSFKPSKRSVATTWHAKGRFASESEHQRFRCYRKQTTVLLLNPWNPKLKKMQQSVQTSCFLLSYFTRVIRHPHECIVLLVQWWSQYFRAPDHKGVFNKWSKSFLRSKVDETWDCCLSCLMPFPNVYNSIDWTAQWNIFQTPFLLSCGLAVVCPIAISVYC